MGLFALQYISLFPNGRVSVSEALRGLFTSVSLIDCTHPNVLTLSHAGTRGFSFGLKADSTVSLWRGNAEVIERQGVQMAGSEKRQGEQKGAE